MKAVILLTGILLLTGCRGAIPRLKKPIETCFVNISEGKVRCHDREFDIVKDQAGERVSESVDRDLEYVDNFMCIPPEGWAIELKPYIKEWNRYYRQNN